MRIGIDAKWYFDGPPSGKRVVKGLVDEILKLNDQNEYVIFLDQKYRRNAFEVTKKKNIQLCYVWAGNNLLSNVFLLPFYSSRFKLDALLYQNFISPFDKSNKVAYIHDVLFLSNPEYYTIFERLYFLPLRVLTKRSDLIVTVSEEEKKRLMRFSFSKNEDKVLVAHHGVDSSFQTLDHFSEQFLSDIKKQFLLPDKFLLYVGRLNLRKNVDNLLRAIPYLKDKSIRLVIVGADDWKKSNYKNVIENLGIENRIHFTGAIFNNLNAIYSMAEIFCFPSHAESFGLPPLEAMASGVPVVVSNTTSLPEICGKAGCYVSPNAPGEIAKMIDDLLTNRSYYEQQRKFGLEQAVKFTWNNAVHIIIEGISHRLNKA